MSGKGDKARPMVITKDKFNSNFDAIFRKPQKKDEEQVLIEFSEDEQETKKQICQYRYISHANKELYIL